MKDKFVSKNEKKVAYRVIDGEAVIVNLENSTFHNLNDVGTFIWEQIHGEVTLNQIIQKICQEFEIDYKIAEKDCLDFLCLI